jgi:hypothetical protein
VPRLGDPVDLDSDQQIALGEELCSYADELEQQHANYFKDISVWWEWYEAKPEVEWRTFPWPGASNLVYPLIMAQADSQVARTLLQMLSTSRLWSATSQNKWWAERLSSMLEFINWGAYHQPGADLLDTLEPAIVEQQVLGEGIWEQTWERRLRPVITPTGKPQLLSFGEGPLLKHRPRERYLFPRHANIRDADIIFAQDFFTIGQLHRIAQSDDKVYQPAFMDLENFSGLDGLAADLHKERQARSGLSEASMGSRYEPHDIRTVYVEMDLARTLASGSTIPGVTSIRGQDVPEVPVPLQVILHRRSRRVLKCIYGPYLLDSPNLYQITRRRGGSDAESGRGMAKDLEHPQRGLTTILNQGIDAVSFGNGLKVIVNDRKLEDKPWIPNRIVYSSNPELAVRELGAGLKNVMPEMQLMGFLQAVGERVGGMSDPNLGRETRMGGHPQPATNFVGLIQQSQINSSRSLKSIRTALSRVGQHRAILYQMFEKNKGDWIQRVFGEKDSNYIMDYLDSPEPIFGQVEFDVHSFSEVHNPDAERQKAVVIDQMVTNHYITVIKAMEVAENPQATPNARQMAWKMIEGKTRSLINFLEASEVDDYEDYVDKLDAARKGNISDLAGLLATRGGGAGPPGQPGAQTLPGPGVVPLPGGAGAPIRSNGGLGGGAFLGEPE